MIELKRPQLAASEIPDLHAIKNWPKYIQPKYDGICCLARDGDALSRTMKDIPNKYIREQFAKADLHGFHGELMLRGGDFNDIQSAIMSRDGEPDFVYYAYDVWDHEGDYASRYGALSARCLNVPEWVILAPTLLINSPEEAVKYLGQFLAEGYEGAMLRDPNSLYKQGRHTLKGEGLLKLKEFSDSEATVIGLEQRMISISGGKLDERGYKKTSNKKEDKMPSGDLGSLVVEWRGVVFNIGSGFTQAQREDIWKMRDIIGKTVTFQYQELSKDGVPRFPTFKGFREEGF